MNDNEARILRDLNFIIDEVDQTLGRGRLAQALRLVAGLLEDAIKAED